MVSRVYKGRRDDALDVPVLCELVSAPVPLLRRRLRSVADVLEAIRL